MTRGGDDARRVLATARKRRQREREKAGGAVLLVPVDDLFGLVDAMIDANRIAVEDSEDRGAIADAISRLVGDWRVTRGQTPRAQRAILSSPANRDDAEHDLAEPNVHLR